MTMLTDEEQGALLSKLRTWLDEGQQLLRMLEGNRNAQAAGIEMEVRLVPDGSLFRKRAGEVLYLRISDDAAKYSCKDPMLVYGVTDYGNMTAVKPETKVVAIPPPNWQEDEIWRELMTELGLYERPEEDK